MSDIPLPQYVLANLSFFVQRYLYELRSIRNPKGPDLPICIAAISSPEMRRLGEAEIQGADIVLINVDTEPWHVRDNVSAPLQRHLNGKDLCVVEPELLHR